MIIIVGALYFVSPKWWIQKLLLISLSFYLLGISSFLSLYLYLIFWLLIWVCQNLLGYIKIRGISPLLLVTAILLALAPMVTWKFYPTEYNSFVYGYSKTFFLLGPDQLPQYLFIEGNKNWFLVGISFATFRAIDLLVKTKINNVGPQSLLNVLTYGFFPPIQIVGPIAEYEEIIGKCKEPKRFELANVVQGLKHCILGLAKIFVLAYPLRGSAEIFLHFDANPAWILWVESTIFAWYLYLNFAGFTDLAVGLSRILGFEIRGNFNFPFFKPNLQLFWANWHMSLTGFAQRNIFVPMGGYRKKYQYLAIAVTMMVIGIWHDLSISLVVFGLYHAIGLCVVRYLNNKNKRKAKITAKSSFSWLSTLGTFTYVMLSFPLLKLPASAIIPFYLGLIGLS